MGTQHKKSVPRPTTTDLMILPVVRYNCTSLAHMQLLSRLKEKTKDKIQERLLQLNEQHLIKQVRVVANNQLEVR